VEAGRRSVEGRGKTVDDAILDALTRLGASRESVDLEVLSEGSRGVWGIGAEDARVRATLKGRGGAPAVPKPPREAREPRPAREAAPRTVAEAAPRAVAEVAPRAVAEVVAEEELPPDASEAEIGRHVVATLLAKMGLSVQVEIMEGVTPIETDSDQPAPIVLNVKGDDLGMLIGRRGETLRDLQFIARLIVSRKVGHWPNLVVDVEEYRQHREQALTQLAQRMAEKVEATGQPATLEPMPPNERRIIHIALRDHPTVTTESTGEGEERKVVIMPR
jgi:spoIIIJ-associated protein